jgi:hypothetical protein
MVDSTQFRQVPKTLAAVERRPIPIAHLSVTATTSGTAQTLFTVRPNVAFEVKRLAVANVTGSTATLSLHSVPSGGTIGVTNAELFAVDVPANSSANLTDFIQGFYEQGTTLEVYSGTSAALTVHGWGEEVL